MISQDVVYTIAGSLFTFIVLLFLTRLMGRKAISQMTHFDFVVSITIGSIGANIAVNNTNSPYSNFTALIILVLLAIITDFMHIASFKFTKLVESEPVVVIENGKINSDAI